MYPAGLRTKRNIVAYILCIDLCGRYIHVIGETVYYLIYRFLSERARMQETKLQIFLRAHATECTVLLEGHNNYV